MPIKNPRAIKASITSKPIFKTERIVFNTGCLSEFVSIIVGFTTFNSIYNIQIIVVKDFLIVVKAPKLVV